MAFISNRESTLSDLISSKRTQIKCSICGGILSLSKGDSSSVNCPFCEPEPSVKLNACVTDSIDVEMVPQMKHEWHGAYMKDKRSWMRRRKFREFSSFLMKKYKAGSVLTISFLVFIITILVFR